MCLCSFYTNTMYYEFSGSGLVTLTLTMLVSVLPHIVPSGCVPLLGVSNSTTDYLLNSTETTSLLSNISESRTPNLTSPVLLSQSSTAETNTLRTTGTESTQLQSSVPSSTPSSFNLLRTLTQSVNSSSNSSTATVSDSNNLISSELPNNRSSSLNFSQLSSTTTTTFPRSSQTRTSPVSSARMSTIPLPVRTTKSPRQQSAFEIVLVKKLLQKWGYMPIKKNGCWIYEDWRKETIDSSSITCPTTPSNSITTPVTSPETSTTYDSISEYPTSELTPPESKGVNGDDDVIPGLSDEEREKFVDGMMVFQKRYKLPVTGRLDESTETVITQRSCSVPDNVNSLPNNESESPTDSSDDHTTDAVNTVRMPSTILTSTKSPQSEYETVTDLTSVTVETELSYTDIVTEMSSESGSIVDEPADIIPTTSNSQRTLFTGGNDRVPSAETSRRRRQSLSNIISSSSRRSRLKRSNQHDNVCVRSWPHSTIYWKIQSIDPSNRDKLAPDSSDFNSEQLRANISEAFLRWSEVSTLRFVEASSGMPVDIYLRFISPWTSSPGCRENCFLGNEMATSTQEYNFYIYLKDDPDKRWSYNPSPTSSNALNLPLVVTHEIGHMLCLPHNTDQTSIMNPNIANLNANAVIDTTSRQQIKTASGRCRDKFVALDWIRKILVDGALVTVYSTYIFRGDHYWKYRNNPNQLPTRENDPRKLYDQSRSEWYNAPFYPTRTYQAAVQARLFRNGININDLYFFLDGRSIKYHQTDKNVIENRYIDDRWRKKPGSSFPNIPRDIKAAYFDKTDGNIYFFNATHVFAYDMSYQNPSEEGCCVDNYPKRIDAAYPGINGYTPPLETHIDGAYYSYNDRILYFFKGDYYWESTYNHRPGWQVGGANVRVGQKQSYKDYKWMDLCEVDHSYRTQFHYN